MQLLGGRSTIPCRAVVARHQRWETGQKALDILFTHADHDPTRPRIEHYRREGEADCLVPINAPPGAASTTRTTGRTALDIAANHTPDDAERIEFCVTTAQCGLAYGWTSRTELRTR